MKENLKFVHLSLMAKVLPPLLMGHHMKGHGRKDWWMEKENSLGMMDLNMKENMLKVKSREEEDSFINQKSILKVNG